MNELTQRGISALRSGDRVTARSLLREAIRIDPDDAAAWLWLTGALDQDDERIDCLKQVLRIDPHNQPAARGLSQILARQKESGQAEQPPAEPAIYGRSESQETPAEEPAAVESTISDTITMQATAGQEIVADLREGFAFSEGETEEKPEDSAIDVAAIDMAVVEGPTSEFAGRGAWVYETQPSDEASTGTVPAETEEIPLPGPQSRSSTASSERRRLARNAAEPLQTIFRTRPSQVPALLGFWFFLIGTAALAYLLRDAPTIALGFSVSLGLILMATVVFALVRNFSVRYELSNHFLSLRFRGRKVRVVVGEITRAECHQTFFQRLIGTGDVRLRAIVHHELVKLRMRNIPDCRRRVEQIHAAVTNAGGNSKP